MIVPVVEESVWAGELRKLPLWTPPNLETVVVAPHPDDETLAAGGLIASLREAGCAVRVVAVTDGENCYAGEDLRRIRPAEQAAALSRLGVGAESIHRLHLPDSSLAAHEGALAETLAALIPTGAHVVAPWPHDFHPDHEICGRAATLAAAQRAASLTYFFFWTWHRGTPELLQDLALVRFPLTGGQVAARMEALRFHRSQLHHSSGHPILPEPLLAPVQRPFEVYLPV